MTGTPNPIKCRSCARTLATVSPEGLMNGPPSEACSTCEQFTSLHDAMRVADEAFRPLISKGDKHRGKQAALAEAARTRMIFHNYLMSIEVVELQDGGPQNENEKEHQSERESTSEEDRLEQHMDGNIVENQPLDIRKSQQLAHRLSSKRTHSITSVPERKRIKFDDSVEFRDDYRPYLELNRSNKDYVPGRYAPPEEGYLDTSGSEISALKFTGMKRVKGGWVEVVPKERKSKKDAPNVNNESQEFGSSEVATSQGEVDRTSQDETDPRVERLQRRTKRPSSADAAASGDSVAHGKRGGTRRRTRASLNRAKDEISEPFRGTVAGAPQEEGPNDLSLIERLEDVEDLFTVLDGASKDHDAHEEAFDVQPANSQPSDDSSRNLTSPQLREEGEGQLSSVFINKGDKENDQPTQTQMEVAQPDSSVVASNKLPLDENHDAHPQVQEISSTIQDYDITGSTDENKAESKRVNEQEREHVFEGSHKPFTEGVSEASWGEEKEKSPSEI